MEHTPESMNYIQIEEHGDPDVLKLSSQPVPDPGLEEVLIRVESAGVNRPDIMQRKGLYPPPPGATDVPGLEVSGTVVKKGKNVAEPEMGSQVCALVSCAKKCGRLWISGPYSQSFIKLFHLKGQQMLID